MCGIAGATINLLGNEPEKILGKMNEVMTHRGPDMGCHYLDSHVGLCHRRLSIIDLTEDGRQPMESYDGRYVIVFNGEIYNFPELKEDLIKKKHLFRTRTDTEVLLNLYIEYGAKLLDKIRGMFAFTIWDKEKNEIFSARDRIGKKPFYYYWDNKEFAFSSELKSIREIETIDFEIDPTAVVDYLKYLFIPHPKSIYKNIYKLEPGHYLILSSGKLTIHEYWDVDFSSKNRCNEEQVKNELLEVIEDAVQCRLISDVPLGAFLSGGVDSSGIVALMAKVASKPVTTCSIGFDNKKHNEAGFAKEFAEEFKTNHHEYYVKDDPLKLVEKLVWHFDEPFADSSMVPTYNVSNLARKNVTVALSGDGGDESFAGYEKYSVDQFENRVRKFVPKPLLNCVEAATQSVKKGLLKKINSLCKSAALHPADAFYVTNTFITDQQLDFILSDKLKVDTFGYKPENHIHRYYNHASGSDHLSKILYTDLKMYLPGDILVKVDRMSMANSLEVRSPLLDHKVIEFAAKIPSKLKMNRGNKKYILKEAFNKILPDGVLKRKKHGFDVPLDNWFRKELKHVAYSALFENEKLDEFFKRKALQVIWEEHQSRKINHGTLLWTLYTFSIWTEM